jgi:hypothetical protein
MDGMSTREIQEPLVQEDGWRYVTTHIRYRRENGQVMVQDLMIPDGETEPRWIDTKNAQPIEPNTSSLTYRPPS